MRVTWTFTRLGTTDVDPFDCNEQIAESRNLGIIDKYLNTLRYSCASGDKVERAPESVKLGWTLDEIWALDSGAKCVLVIR